MSDYDKVIEHIAYLIKSKGLKQSFVAEKAGLTDGELSNILNDRRKLLRVQHIAPLCKALGITPNELFDPDGKTFNCA